MKRKAVFKLSKGYFGRTGNVYTLALRQVQKGLQHAYRDRKLKKRDYRSTWIQQINAGSRQFGINYSQFAFGLVKSNIALNRKILADLAVNEPYSFQAIAEHVKLTLGDKWDDTFRRSMAKSDYERFLPDEIPPQFLPEDPNEPIKYGWQMINERFAKAEKKAAEINEELIKSGKAVLPAVEKVDSRVARVEKKKEKKEKEKKEKAAAAATASTTKKK